MCQRIGKAFEFLRQRGRAVIGGPVAIRGEMIVLTMTQWLSLMVGVRGLLIWRFLVGTVAMTVVLTDEGAMRNEVPITKDVPAQKESWRPIFTGTNLAGWEIIPFHGGGAASVEEGQLIIEAGQRLSGIRYTNSFPQAGYEIALEAMKIEGNDFFCGLTFPVGTNHCTLIVDGWGGGTVGLSNVEGMDAGDNETTRHLFLERHRWYPIRLRVSEERIEVWIEGDKEVDLNYAGKQIGLRPGDIEYSRPVGLTTFRTKAAWRRIRFRLVGPGEVSR